MRARSRALGLALVLVLAAPGAASAADPLTWRLEQPPAPESDQPFVTPLGPVGDIRFIAPNRGLMTTAGTSVVPEGVYTWDGRTWSPYANVCGGDASTARIAVASPTEFWTIADPAAELRATDTGTTLCRFKDGAVVASYAAPPEAADPYFAMNAAACRAPDDCWFGGGYQTTPDSARRGAFHLHWNGAEMRTVYAPQGRGVSDLLGVGDETLESVFVGPNSSAGGTEEAPLTEPESVPKLLHHIRGTVFTNDPFEPAPQPDVPVDGTELRALDGAGPEVWAVGGAGSPRAGTAAAPRAPLVVRRDPGTGVFAEVPIDSARFATTDRFVDLAVVPGTQTAWVSVQSRGALETTAARVVRISASGEVLDDVELPGGDDPPLGAAGRIACSAISDCWMVTVNGWLFHWSDNVPFAQDTGPAFANRVTSRPPDARTPQAQNDRPPVDDSEKFKPSPQTPPPTEVLEPDPPQTIPLLRRVKSKLRGERDLVISFSLSRKARVTVIGRRQGEVVARSATRTLKPGRRRLVLRLPKDTRRWPKKIDFATKKLGPAPTNPQGGDDDEETVITR